jgi:hypothetical protein
MAVILARDKAKVKWLADRESACDNAEGAPRDTRNRLNV